MKTKIFILMAAAVLMFIGVCSNVHSCNLSGVPNTFMILPGENFIWETPVNNYYVSAEFRNVGIEPEVLTINEIKHIINLVSNWNQNKLSKINFDSFEVQYITIINPKSMEVNLTFCSDTNKTIQGCLK